MLSMRDPIQGVARQHQCCLQLMALHVGFTLVWTVGLSYTETV